MNTRKRACTFKIRYPDEANARARLAHLLQAKGYRPTFIYKCAYCHGYHASQRGEGVAIMAGEPWSHVVRPRRAR